MQNSNAGMPHAQSDVDVYPLRQAMSDKKFAMTEGWLDFGRWEHISYWSWFFFSRSVSWRGQLADLASGILPDVLFPVPTGFRQLSAVAIETLCK